MGNYIALDQSLAFTGWAVGQLQDSCLHISHGVFCTESTEMTLDRLVEIQAFVSGQLKLYDPSYVFTEEVYDRADLIKVETCIHLMLHGANVPFCIVPSSARKRISWRKVLGISPEKSRRKVEAINYLTRFELDIKTSHEAEAICILLTGLLNLKVIGDLESIRVKVDAESNEKAA